MGPVVGLTIALTLNRLVGTKVNRRSRSLLTDTGRRLPANPRRNRGPIFGLMTYRVSSVLMLVVTSGEAVSTSCEVAATSIGGLRAPRAGHGRFQRSGYVLVRP